MSKSLGCGHFGESYNAFRNEMTYEGSMQNSTIHGKGVLIHHDTGNEYHGMFNNNHKHGACEFILKTGDKKSHFVGEFRHGVEKSSASNYHPKQA